MNEILMEKTEKFMCGSEDFAEKLVERYKDEQSEYMLVDWKLTRKETKEGEYFIVTLKSRYYTLAEAKEQL